ncbi:MAG TPA: conjugative transposon protein TraM [Sphingobacterium sp.]|nr:conjugative transposon protein TraM [Sphingobacterium sp.]
MKKINFKQGRYILPLLFIPFFYLGFWLLTGSSSSKKNTQVVVKNDVNDDLAPTSKDVSEKKLSDKLEEYRRNYKEGDGYTAINPIETEVAEEKKLESLYSDEEKRMLDSLEQEVKLARERSENAKEKGFKPRSENISENDRMLLSLLNQQNQTGTEPVTHDEEEPNPVDLMKEQFKIIDSVERSRDPEYQKMLAEQKRQEQLLQEKREREARQFTVQKASNTKGIFNTIKTDADESFIKAIIDENIKVYAGSRIRLKLMEDILIGKELIKRGTYLYAMVDGFSQQRITFSITSVMQGNKILPINLEVYDVDGMEGLYVPASAFREFTKELGGKSMQGMNISAGGGDGEQQSQFLMSTVQRAFMSTSRAIAEAIKKNKANIKYSTYIYLIDPQELKNNQRNEKTN